MKLINEKLLPPLTDEQEQGFAAELAKKCLLVARILLPVVLLLTLIDLIDLFFINPDAESLTGRVRAVYYVFLAVVSASFCIYLLHVYKNVFVKAKRVLLYTYLYSCFVCVWSTVIIPEILRQYFINHPQSIDKYTFLQNSAFTHWVKEKCSKMC